MKPPSFEYYAPTNVDEALAHLAEHGWDAKVLAGGQSLIPMMNFRLAQPSILVDLNNVSELAYIKPDDDGGLLLGAMARHHQVESSPLVAERAPLIYETMPKIATQQIRSRGTFGGSIAHADPSAELPAVSVALDGRYRIKNQDGERWVPANEFILGMYTTAMEPEELLVEIAIPAMEPRTGWAMVEVARRPHDFALVGAAAVVTLDDKDRCKQAKLVLFSVGDRPVEALKAMEVLKGQALNAEVIQAAAEAASAEDIEPSSDIHATAEFRHHLAKVLAQRALEQAVERAQSNGKANKSQGKRR
jgi:carbon-monoxide dehydrogenase medium subunit